tara:strand:+ start:978 stop:1298 length:321 start_codon:yes stop_codon:yes gene_type:complete
MPAMNKLISKLNESPPRHQAELEDMLEECGYSLAMDRPGEGDDYQDSEGEEYEEDMGPDDDSFPQELVGLLPDGMQDPGTNPRQKTRAMTIIVAKKLGNKEEGKHG